MARTKQFPSKNPLFARLPKDLQLVIIDKICTGTRRSSSVPATSDDLLGPMLNANHAFAIRNERVGAPPPPNALVLAWKTLIGWSSACRATRMDEAAWRFAFRRLFTSPLDQLCFDDDVFLMLRACTGCGARALFACMARACSAPTWGVARAVFEVQHAWNPCILRCWTSWWVRNARRCVRPRADGSDKDVEHVLVVLQRRGTAALHELAATWMWAPASLPDAVRADDAAGVAEALSKVGELGNSWRVDARELTVGIQSIEVAKLLVTHGAVNVNANTCESGNEFVCTLMGGDGGVGSVAEQRGVLAFAIRHLDPPICAQDTVGGNWSLLVWALNTRRYRAAHVLLDHVQALSKFPRQSGNVAFYLNAPCSISGNTALMCAALSIQDDFVFRLLELGADPRYRRGDGKCALDLAPSWRRGKPPPTRPKQLKQVKLLLELYMRGC